MLEAWTGGGLAIYARVVFVVARGDLKDSPRTIDAHRRVYGAPFVVDQVCGRKERDLKSVVEQPRLASMRFEVRLKNSNESELARSSVQYTLVLKVGATATGMCTIETGSWRALHCISIAAMVYARNADGCHRAADMDSYSTRGGSGVLLQQISVLTGEHGDLGNSVTPHRWMCGQHIEIRRVAALVL